VVNLEHLARPATAGAGVMVTAVEDTCAQVVWSDLPAGTVTVSVAGRRREVLHPGGPGALEIDGLSPGSCEVLDVMDHRGNVVASRRVRVLERPPGDELCRFATISDLHLGRGMHGLHGHLRGTDPPAPSVPDAEEAEAAADNPHLPLHCARAATAEATAWGADHLVIKGDVVDETDDWTWDMAQDLLGSVTIPTSIVPGNHDLGRLRRFEPEVGAAARGLHLVRGVDHVDLPGVRVALVDPCCPGNGWGRIARHAEAVADLALTAPSVFVATHQQAQRFTVPYYWPHGIPGPDARSFAATVRSANPRAMASSGHTHRNRVRRVAGLTWTEVAATNHYPGVWAGYRVFEGGIMQVVRRIVDPAALAWTEASRTFLGGVWALWSTGSPSDRSTTVTW
jgi:3',5'-cyclic-AMP phosphodiesterase